MGIDTYVIENSKLKIIYFHLALAYEYKYGERPKVRGNWSKWFGKEWKQADYCRTDYYCFANSDSDPHWAKWYHQAKGTLTNAHGMYNAKAVLLKNVDVEDVLFGTTEDSSTYSLVPQMRGHDVEEGQCAVAHGKYGNGSASFFGDVNAEQETCRIMSIIAGTEFLNGFTSNS